MFSYCYHYIYCMACQAKKVFHLIFTFRLTCYASVCMLTTMKTHPSPHKTTWLLRTATIWACGSAGRVNSPQADSDTLTINLRGQRDGTRGQEYGRVARQGIFKGRKARLRFRDVPLWYKLGFLLVIRPNQKTCFESWASRARVGCYG